MKKVELLSPAGDYECLKMAVFGGANAVYFGAKNFNARAKADNFGAELAEAVAFCHMYDVKAYLTLNTLIENEQVEYLIHTVKFALECGVDAFIVQDFGVLNILKNVFSSVEIHTSTQMAVNNYAGALMAQKMGAKRVVLSRETNLEDIRLIKENTNLEIEYFIQGALCVCFSGNCYLSSKLFSKSGNKGECLQPCRLPYKAILKDRVIGEGYLLSAKDNCMAKRLKELIDSGVDSFKIEGRLRRAGYVSSVTKTYRQIIDNNYKVENDDILNIKKAFNRGDFTEGYLNGNADIIYSNIQGHIGVEIGKVINFKKGNKFNEIYISTNHKINKGDGLKFIFDGIEISSMSALDIKTKGNVTILTGTNFVKVGASVRLIVDSKKEEDILQEIKRLPIDFKLSAMAGEKLKLEFSFKDVCGTVLGEICESAENKPLTKEDAKESLGKLGDTYFYLNNFEFDSNGVFVRKSEINNLRRSAVEEILQKFSEPKGVDVQYEYLENLEKIKQNSKKINKNTLNLIDFGEKYTSLSEFLIIKPKNYLTFEYSKIDHENAYLYIPSFLRNEDFEVIKNILNKNKNLGIYAENIGALCFDRKTILGAKLNIKNIYAIKELVNNNVTAIVTSPEISDDNFIILQNYSSVPVIKSSLKNFDLMTYVHCPIKTLFKNTCSNCKYVDGIIYQMENGTKLTLNRYKIINCYFTLN